MNQIHNVAVIGGSGRLGRHVVTAVAATAKVTVVDLAPPPDTLHPFIKANINDLDGLISALEGFDALILTAAIPNPRSAPEQVTFTTNVVGTWNVLQAARTLGIKRVVVASSDAVTGLHYHPSNWQPQYLPIDEEHPLRPSEVYSLTKEITEAICRSFAAESDMAVIALRPAHIVYPPEYPELRERGADPANYHCWTYVHPDDVAQAFVLALAAETEPGTCESYFIAAAETLSERPTLEICSERWNQLPIRQPELYEQNPHASVFSITKAVEQLGYRPTVSWRDLVS